MNSLIFNWIIILIIAGVLSYLWKSWSAFKAGIITIIIAGITTSAIHYFWISSGDFIWAMIAVSHASYWSGFFTSITKN